MKIKHTERSVLDLLAKRHGQDLFVSQCKNGPTLSGPGHIRLDAWAMKRSWSLPTFIGYEIKVSRQDFMRDEKGPAYLPLCHQFYFVAPKGVIQPAEVPEQAGLITVYPNTLRAVKKAPRRTVDVEKINTLFMYILISRTEIVHTTKQYQGSNNVEYWTNWLEDKKENNHLGYRVRGKIRKLYDAALRERDKALHLVTEYEGIKRRIQELGFDPDTHPASWSVYNKLANLVESTGLRRDLGHLRDKINKVLEEM